MGFLWEGSTGARAVKLLRELPQGTAIPTPAFAKMLGVTGAALHQLLANAVQLRLVKKIRNRGPCILWALGAGNDSATIERRRPVAPPPTPAELARRAAAAARRAARQAERAAASPDVRFISPAWPPGFVSTFDRPALRYRPLADSLVDDGAAVDADADLPTWLRGLVPGSVIVPAPVARIVAPGPQQLVLFDPREIGEPGHLRRRRPAATLHTDAPTWLQISFLEPLAA